MLAACRRSAGLSQQELAERAGLSVRAVGNMERGRVKVPHPATMRRLADALGLAGQHREALLAAAGRRLAGPDGGLVVPRQLPGPVRHFAGRRAELELLTGLLGEAAAVPGPVLITTIGGMAGVGKTALAVHWAHQVTDLFPDGQLYVNLRGFDPTGRPVEAAEAIRGVLEALGVAPRKFPD